MHFPKFFTIFGIFASLLADAAVATPSPAVLTRELAAENFNDCYKGITDAYHAASPSYPQASATELIDYVLQLIFFDTDEWNVKPCQWVWVNDGVCYIIPT